MEDYFSKWGQVLAEAGFKQRRSDLFFWEKEHSGDRLFSEKQPIGESEFATDTVKLTLVTPRFMFMSVVLGPPDRQVLDIAMSELEEQKRNLVDVT